MDPFISVIIPNRNGSATIGKCLKAVYASQYHNFEVIVVDDCSADNSVEIIKKFPCLLIKLKRHSGAAHARNIGAANSRGDILFFTDADCLMQEDTLLIAYQTLSSNGHAVIVGGTYTKEPYDKGFFSHFQSLFINYSETKNMDNPDYIATHAMVIYARTFRESGGFSEFFLPILEDVELSHRLRRRGHSLLINPSLLVQHIFNYSLAISLQNAVKKSMYWTIYSLRNKDLFADSGTASVGLKINVVSCFLILLIFTIWIFFRKSPLLYLVAMIFGVNTFTNKGLIMAFQKTKGTVFALFAYMYYTLVYPFAVGAGVFLGMIRYMLK
jgi:glycosyltransferase involved in cell wall biosynthesis